MSKINIFKLNIFLLRSFSFKDYVSVLFALLFICSNKLIAQAPDTTSQSDPLINHCISIVNDVETKGNIIGQLNLDSLGQLPLGIARDVGGSQIIIAIDSASFYANKASFNCYAAIDFPGSSDKIAFRAQNIEFNPKGIIGGNMARLLLVSNHRIRVNPNVTLVLKAYDNNYVKWNCNGFEAIHLKGYFEFSRNIIMPDTTSSNGVGTGSVVTASFEIETTDIHNFIAQVSVSPFVLKNVKDVSFSILEATVDMSEIASAPSMVFPAAYDFNGTTPIMWQGFYLKHLKVKLPKALSQKGQGRKEVIVSDFLIDNTGVSGKFQLTNVISAGQGDMSGWGFSITQLGLTFVQNHINGGSISGELEIPISDETQFGYNAIISENPNTKETDFQFTISPKNGIKANLFSATVDLYNTSTITVTKIGQQFKPEANLNGIISFNSANFKGANLKFQDIHIISERPIFVGGTFAYTSANQTGTGSEVANNNDDNSGNNAAGFKIGINVIAFQFAQNSPPSIYVNVGLQFMGEDDGGGLGATCGILLKTKYKDSYQNDGSVLQLDKLKFDRVQLTDIFIDVETQAFGLKGYVIFFDNDPTFGKGFMGGVKINVKSAGVLVDINAAFGSKSTYKYFYVDGAVKLPTAIPICYALGLWGFKGGLYYHMRPLVTSIKGGMVNLMQSPQAALATQHLPYVPDSTSAIGFKAGIMFGLMGKDDIFNGDIEIELQFNTNGGLDFIGLKGDVALMCSINDKMSKPSDQIPIHGTTDTYYDFVNKVFHMTNTVTFNIQGIVSGGGQNVIHYEPSKWYLYIGKPSARVNVNIYDLVNVTSYFMVGTEVEPMPPPPSYVNVAYGDSRNMQSVSSGNGFVAGAALSVDIDKEFGFDFFQVHYWLHGGAGFDMMLGKFKSPWHCDGRSGPPGFRGWFAQGQIWAYVNGGVGINGDIEVEALGIKVSKSFDFTVASINIAAILSGKAPNPIYVEGYVHADYEILEVVSGSFDFNFNEGTDCALVQ